MLLSEINGEYQKKRMIVYNIVARTAFSIIWRVNMV